MVMFQIRDGYNETAPLIGSYCGYSIPSPKFTTGNSMTVIFESSYSLRPIGSGFRATWTVGMSMFWNLIPFIIQLGLFYLVLRSNKTFKFYNTNVFDLFIPKAQL